jgi:hypothetical protein
MDSLFVVMWHGSSCHDCQCTGAQTAHHVTEMTAKGHTGIDGEKENRKCDDEPLNN